MSFRRLFAITLLTVSLGSAAILGLFFYRLDIDLYRPEIEQELTRRAHLPLSLGKVSISFKHGPAIAFDSLQAGGDGYPIKIAAKSLYLRLRLLPMLYGQLAFSEILFEEPDIVVTARVKTAAMPDGGDLTDVSGNIGELFRSIRIRKGNFRFEDHRNASAPFIFALEQLDLNIDDLSFSSANHLEVSGDLLCNKVRSPLHISGAIVPNSEIPGWRHADYTIDATIRDLASDIISGYLRRSAHDPFIRGRSDFNLHFTGIPAEGARFQTHAAGRDLGLHLPGTGKLVLPIGGIDLDGTWQMTENRHAIDDLHLKVGALELQGSIGLDLSTATPQITARLASLPTALADLEQMLPSVPGAPLSPPYINAGRLTLETLEVAGNADQITGNAFPAGVQRLTLRIDQADLGFGSTRISEGEASVDWNQHTLRIDRIAGKLGSADIEADGRLVATGNIDSGLALSGDGHLRLKSVTSGGATPLLPEQLDIPYQLHWTQEGIDTQTLQLQLAPEGAPLHLAARWSRPVDAPQQLTVDAGSIPIGGLANLSPLLRRLSLDGELAARLELVQTASGWQPTTTLQLLNAKTPIPGPLAELHDINGTAVITGLSLQGKGFDAVLGHSPIRVDVDILNLAKPLTTLHVTAPAIQARDLVFSSPTMTVDDVDGIVQIGPGRVELGPIEVVLAGGTEATVFGGVNTRNGDVDLAINSCYGDIDEVINLWSDTAPVASDRQEHTETAPMPAPPPPPPVHSGPHGKLDIRVSADRGNIAGMPFTEATARITRHDETLIISPIRFRSGPGKGLGQVLLVHRDQGPPLLKISGNLYGFDAPVIHQQLLKRNSIISGSLSADFYLEGVAGSDFLPTSLGGAVLELRDGNLHKISWLSKTLAILNIYPLLTGVDSDPGLPYAKVNATLAMRQGIISTEDLVLKGDVMNLSLVGSQNLITDRIDATLEAMPLRSVDRILTRVPIAGWLLTGKSKALVVAHFKVNGPSADPDVEAVPLESVSGPVIGIFKRLIGLPVKLITDPGTVLQNR